MLDILNGIIHYKQFEWLQVLPFKLCKQMINIKWNYQR